MENQENGEPGQSVAFFHLLQSCTVHDCRSYNTTLRNLIPLPDPNAPPNSAMHPNSYEEHLVGSIVMGLYPDTSCFYRAEVVAAPGVRVGSSNLVDDLASDTIIVWGSIQKSWHVSTEI